MRLTFAPAARLLRAAPLLVVLGVAAACGPIPTAGSSSPSASPSPGGRFGGFARDGAFGKLVGIKGRTLTLSGESGESTVTYSHSTSIERTSTGSLSDIVTGTCIVGTGSKGSDGAVTATTVEVRPKTGGSCAAAEPGGGSGRPFPTRSPGAGGFPGGGGGFPGGGSFGLVEGEVTAVSGTQVTVETSSGSESLTVPTSARITDQSSATASALQVDVCVTATGQRSSSGTVAASALTLSQPDSSGTCTEAGFGPGGGGGFPGRGGGG
jgi:hypothetical protein